MWDLISFPTASKVASLFLFRSVATRALLHGGARRAVQRRFCTFWLGCFDSYPSSWCHQCSIPSSYLANQTDVTALVSGARPRSFVAQFDNQYAWSAVPWVVSFSIVSFAASFAILRYIGRVWLLQCLVISLAIGSIAMITGYSFSAYEPQAPASGLCGAADLSPWLTGQQALSLDCLLRNAAQGISHEMNHLGTRSLSYGCGVGGIVILLEAVSYLNAVVDRLRGIDDWAIFEMKVLMWHFVGTWSAIGLGWALWTSGALAGTEEAYRSIVRFAQRSHAALGPTTMWDLGLTMSVGTSELQLAEKESSDAERVGWRSPISLTVMVLLVLLHVVGLLIECRVHDYERRWHRVVFFLRGVLITDVALFSTYILLNLVVALTQINGLSILTVLLLTLLMVQFLHTVFYAVQSGLLPIGETLPANPILRATAMCAWAAPVSGLVLTTIGWGLQYRRDQNHFLGVTVAVPMMMSGIAILLATALGAAALFRNTLIDAIRDQLHFCSEMCGSSSQASDSESLVVGAQVLTEFGDEGTVRFRGPTSFGGLTWEGEKGDLKGEWLGIELRQAKGDNDGSKQGVRYFTCAENHGLFVRAHKVELLLSSSTRG